MTEELINSPIENSIVESLSTSNTLPSNKLTSFEEHNSDSDDVNGSLSYSRTKTKSKLLAKLDSDYDKEDDFNQVELSLQKTDFNDQSNTFLHNKKKSRIKYISSSESETESKLDNESNEADGNYDLTRSKMKKNELHDKFRKFKSRPKTFPKETIDKLNSGSDDNNESNNSDDGISCSLIKQKLKKKSRDTLKSICDPDTSDEETNISVKKQPSKSRSTKLTSPKAVRMSVKQAMENMQKIKSESNRMLREKEVSLPYHRPKALTLKDIMNRRRPGLSSDGKSLPIKMNNEQLKQYAISLEQRQQEMMELCKSDTDNEEECLEEVIPLKGKDSQLEANNQISDGGIQIMVNETVDMISDVNDKTFDGVIMEQNTESNLEDKVGDIQQLTPDKISQIKNNRDLANNNDSQDIVKEITENKKDPGIVFMVIDSVHETERVNNEPTANCNDTEKESQLISLHYDSEKSEVPCVHEEEETNEEENYVNPVNNTEKVNSDEQLVNLSDEFSDTEFTQEELDKIIENAEVNKETSSRPMLHFGATLGAKPKITGAPGMLIDLGADCSSKKLTGVELLKERFTYFAKLKTSEDMEKDREKKFKPGTQHLKLKQELEEKLAEKRSLEWTKRLEEENKLKTEISDVERELYDGENIEKIEAKLEDDIGDQEISTSEEEEEVDICDLKEKRRKQNPLIDDEAEVSEDDVSDSEDDKVENHEDRTITSEDDNDDESSESEREKEKQLKPRKGRILKAFEDSDDENGQSAPSIDTAPHTEKPKIRESQDDEIQLAQPQNACSEDLFASQESSQKSLSTDLKQDANSSLEDLGSQTFSILKSGSENICSEKLVSYEKLDVICETQPCTDDNFDAIVGMCTGGFAENLVTPQDPSSQLSTSQEIGEDIAALCTGKFYDNPFVSQVLVENETDFDSNIAIACTNDCYSEEQREIVNTIEKPEENIKSSEERKSHDKENTLLKSILNELANPEFDSPKPNKYFCGASKYSNKDDDTQNVENTQLRKKLVIESDDEVNDVNKVTEKKKKLKKRKFESRALQISDDEEENSDLEEETNESDLEEDKNREVEYDSEENEVEIEETKVPKKRLGRDFFEQEAELSSEDEWMGSGDEDERGLDRMEREEGDDDVFHQGRLQRKLGEIHMREVLDQDKREVRLLQELLFEDGDLGDGHRQRKFRWKNADGEEELGTNVNEYADTQEEEFESEEQWRKQRHEREMFLRKLQGKDEEDSNVPLNRSAIIKSHLYSKSATTSTSEQQSNVDETTKPKAQETDRKIVSEIPSPTKPFTIFQQSYHNSLLGRGRGALARLAALATPLAADGDDAPKANASSRGNFVFAAVTPHDTEPKVAKRKADTTPDTPRLLKKMKQQANSFSKSSLLDHL